MECHNVVLVLSPVRPEIAYEAFQLVYHIYFGVFLHEHIYLIVDVINVDAFLREYDTALHTGVFGCHRAMPVPVETEGW